MTEEEKADLEEHGYVVLPGVFSSDQADEMRERVVELAREDRETLKEKASVYLDGKSQRVWNLVNKGVSFEETVQVERVLEFHKHMLDWGFILSSYSANIIGPESPPSALHIDYPMGDMPVPLPEWTFCSNSVYLLTDFTIENGGTAVIPGSHRRDYGPSYKERYPGIQQVEAKKGDVIIVNGRIWHGSGENTTDEARVALLCFYCRRWMPPQQDHSRLVRQEVWDRATPALRTLLGEQARVEDLY
jgi:ectoine hydroxylase-related dioxygenase (phytanoyl-CoA dioxygenase family)